MGILNIDGWKNILTGMGILNRDKAESTRPGPHKLLNQIELEDLYIGDGLGRVIVDCVAETMTREWIEVEAQEFGDAVMTKLEALGAKAALTDLVRWGRLYGGALAVIGLNDGLNLDEPVNEAAVRDIIFLKVYDRHQVSYSTMDLYESPLNPKFGEPEFYTVNPLGGQQFRVHESRVIRMDGDPLPARARQVNQGWGASVLQAPYEALRNSGTAYRACVQIIHEFIVSVLKMRNLADMIAAGNDQYVKDRLQILDLSKGLLNTVVVDEGEAFERHSATTTGLPDMLDRFIRQLAATSRIPVTVLMGQSPAGLNASGDSDIRNWYDNVKSEQADRLLPAVKRIVYLVLLSKDFETGGRVPEGWRVCFQPLWQMSDTEQAALRKTVAETDQIYIEMGAVNESEIRQSRFGSDEWSMEITLDPAMGGAAVETPEA